MAILCDLPQSFEVGNFKETERPGQNLRETCTGSSDSEDKFGSGAECLPRRAWLGQAAHVWCRLSKGRLWHLCGMTSFSRVCSEMMKYEEEREFKTQGLAGESASYTDLPPAMTPGGWVTQLCC